MEIWKDIQGYEGFYQVSNMGKVKSLSRIDIQNKKVDEKILKIGLYSSGYPGITLAKNGKKTSSLIHILVAKAFIPSNSKIYVNHINGIKTDNRVENLEWCTASENNIHAFKIGLSKSPMQGKYGSKHVASKPVLQCDQLGNVIKEHESIIEAAAYVKIKPSGINRALKLNHRRAGGYFWKYKINNHD